MATSAAMFLMALQVFADAGVTARFASGACLAAILVAGSAMYLVTFGRSADAGIAACLAIHADWIAKRAVVRVRNGSAGRAQNQHCKK